MVETIEQIQRRPEYLETLEKGLLDAILGRYVPGTGGQPGTFQGGIIRQPGLFTIPQYQMAGQTPTTYDPATGRYTSFGLESFVQESLKADANANGIPDFMERYQPFFGQAGDYVTGGGEALYRGLGSLGEAASFFGPAAQYVTSGAGMYRPQDYISEFMSPYTEEVIQRSMADIEREGDVARQRAAAQAVGAGAFGGSRQGLQTAEIERAILDTKAKQAAGLRQAGYGQALESSQNAYQQAQTRALEAGRLLGGLGQSFGQLGSQYGTLGSQYGQLGGTTADIGRVYSALGPADLATMYGYGEAERQYRQQQLDVARQEQMRPLEQALLPYNYAYSVLSGTPSASLYSQYTSQTQPATNPYLAGLGAYTALQGVYGQQ